MRYGRFCIRQWLTVNWLTWFRNTNLWHPRTSWFIIIITLYYISTITFFYKALYKNSELWGLDPPNRKKKLLNFSTKSTIFQKLNIGKSIFHSFHHIAHLSCKYGHFWGTTIFFGQFWWYFGQFSKNFMYKIK